MGMQFNNFGTGLCKGAIKGQKGPSQTLKETHGNASNMTHMPHSSGSPNAPEMPQMPHEITQRSSLRVLGLKPDKQDMSLQPR